MLDRPEIVCICGSARFASEMRAANRDLTFAGVIVVAPGEADGGGLTDEQKTLLDALHLRKIDLADRVLIVNPGGYLGESTRSEIAYARAAGKPVSFTDPLNCADQRSVRIRVRESHARRPRDPHEQKRPALEDRRKGMVAACEDAAVVISVDRLRDPAGVDRVLRTLPEWFGIDEARASYVEKAGRLESFVARDKGATVGVALLDRHFPESAELALLAVHRDFRGQGIGRRLVAAVEEVVRTDQCRYLEVYTVGPSYADDGYADTRAFYTAMGFAPVHEFDHLDWDGPTLLMIKSL